MLLAALDLYRQVDICVQQNIQKIRSILEFGFSVDEKLEVLIFRFSAAMASIKASSYAESDKKCQDGELEDHVNTDSCLDNRQFNGVLTNELKNYVNENILSVRSNESYFEDLLTTTLSSINTRYFNISTKKCYSAIMNHLFNVDHVSELSTHQNFEVIEDLKIVFNKTCKSMIKGKTSSITDNSSNKKYINLKTKLFAINELTNDLYDSVEPLLSFDKFMIAEHDFLLWLLRRA